ncbi:MAG: hypothetical protein V4543_16435, partial [Bacteroidota bacterium]
MKNIYCYILLILSFWGLMPVNKAIAQSGSAGANGDIRLIASANLASAPATFQIRQAGVWVTPTGNLGANLSGSVNVFVQKGCTLTINTGTAAINYLNINNGLAANGGVVSVATGATLNLNGQVRTFSNAALINTSADGVFPDANPQVAGMLLTAGTGKIAFIGSSRAVPLFSTAGTLPAGWNMAVSMASNSATLNASGYSLNSLSVTAGTFSFGNAGANALTLTGTTSPAPLTVSSGATLDMTGSGLAHSLTLSGIGGVATMAGTFSTTAASGSSVNYTANGAQTMFASPNYQKLLVSGTGTATKTTGGSISVADLMTFSASAAPVSIAAGHTLTLSSASGIAASGRAYFTGTTSTSNFIASAITTDYSIYAAGTSVFGDLSLGSGIVTLGTLAGNSLTVNGSFSQASGGTLHFGGTTARTLSLGSAATFNAANIDMSGLAGHVLSLGSAVNTLDGVLTSLSGNTVTYNAAGPQSVFPSLTYKNLTISGSGIKTLTGTSNAGALANLAVTQVCTVAAGA